MRLTDTGFDENCASAKVYYQLDDSRVFAVSDTFPRLTRSLVPAGIQDASYVIDLNTCAQFESELGSGHGDQ
jgi:hypothetical protein